MRFVEYLQEPVRDADGSPLPGSRLDLILCVPATLAAMACLAFLSEPTTIHTILKCLCSALMLVGLVAICTYKRSVTGCVAFIIAVRCVIGLIIYRQLTMGVAAVSLGLIAFLLLRDVEVRR